MNKALRNTQNLLRSVLLILVANLFLTSLLYAQVGPAGVGNSDGSSGEPENLIWLDASDLTSFSDGDTWLDKSGNNYDALYTGTIGTSPTWNSSLIGGKPALQFDGSNDYLRILDDNGGDNRLDGKSTLSILAVFNSGTVVPRAIISKRAGSGGSERSWTLFVNGGGFNLNGYAGSASASGGNVSEGSVGSVIGSYVADGNLKLFVNGNNVATSGSASINDLDDNVTIGLFDDGDNRYFDGDIAEILVYSEPLNNPQRTIVENYLGQKYSITISNDYFGNGTGYDGAYDQDIRGVGSDGTDKRTNSLSSGGLTIRENSSSLDADEYVMLAHSGTAHSITTNNRADVTNITNRWSRDWYVEKNNGGGLAGVDGGDVSVQMVFDFAEAGLTYSGTLSEYVLLYRPASGDDFDRVYADSYTLEGGDKIVVSVPSSRLNTGYYTLGTGAPLLAKTWYVFQNGNWNDPNTWTTDASTAPLFKNPANQTPSTSDEVIIRSGRTVTVQASTNNLIVNSIKVDGNLDLTTSSGHDFKTINGKGEIRIAGNGGILVDNFPAGEVTGNIGFADVDNGGTVVIKAAADITLDQVRTFKNMRISLVNNTSKAILGANISLNGDLEVRNGNLQFGDGTANARTFVVNGDVLVTDNGTDRIGSISTSTANARHTFEIKGDFTNNGDVYFTNRADFATENDRRSPGHTYYNNEASDGIVDVFFTNDNADQTVNCNNTTFFYRVVIDKGTDKTYKVSFQSTDIDNFRLLGYANDNVDADLQSAIQNTNAFALINGTAEIGGNIEIPVLNRATNYAISSTARLWVNGGDVRKTSATAIVPYGTVQVSAGYLEATGNSGLTLRENGLIKVEGGNILTNQIRTSVQGSGSLGGYNQSGGNVEVDGGLGGASGDYYIFSLTYTGNVFIMSGGTLAVKGANSRGLIFINSDPGNISVTGGTVTAESSTTNAAKITSRASFYNLEITNSISSTNTNARVTVSNGSSGNGGSERTIDPAPDLVVLNDLTIETGTTRSDGTNTYGSYLDLCPDGVNCSDLEVGRNLTIEDSGVLDLFTNDADDAGSATVTFNGTENGILYVGNITSYKAALTNYDDPDGDESYIEYRFPLYNLVIDKSGGTLQLQAKNPGVEDNGNILTASGGKNLDSNNARLLYIRNGLTISSNSTLNQIDPIGDQFGYIVRAYADTIDLDGNLLVYEQGVNPVNSFLEVREKDQPTVGDIILINSTSESTIGNLVVDLGNDELRLGGDLTVTRMAYRHGGVNLGTHNLKVDILDLNTESKTSDDHRLRSGNGENLFGDNTSGAEQYFFTAGNASDGGLSIKVPRTTNIHGVDDTQNVGFDPSYDNTNNEYQNNNLIWFPIGIKDKYTPAVMYIVNDGSVTYSGDEYVTVRPVDGELQTTDLSGGDILSYYWRIGHEGFDGGLPTVSWLFQYDQDDIDGGAEGNYVPGKVLDSGTYQRSYDGTEQAVKNTNTSGNGSVNDTNENHNLLGGNPGNVIIFNGLNTGNTLPLPAAVADDNIDNSTNSKVFNGASVTGNWDPQFPNIGFTLENASYTAGVAARFVGTPEIYYSRRDGDWHSFNTWSTDVIDKHEGSAASDYPQIGDIAIIAGATSDDSHAITISEQGSAPNDIEVASLTFDGGNSPQLTIQTNGSLNSVNLGVVEGTNGTSSQIVREIAPSTYTLEGDFGQWASLTTNTFQYKVHDNNTSIPTNLSEFPNLIIAGNQSGNKGSAGSYYNADLNHSINVLGAMGMRSRVRLFLQDGFTGSINVEDTLLIGNSNPGVLVFPETGEWTVTVGGINLLGESQSGYGKDVGILVDEDATVEHRLIVKGDIRVEEKNSGSGQPDIDLYANTGGGGVILEFQGELNGITDIQTEDGSLLVPELYKIVMNKGSDVASSFTFNNNFSLPDINITNEQPIEILNGLLILNNSSIDVTLTEESTGNFFLPNTNNADASSGSGGLEIRQGVAHIDGDNTGIILDGLLHVSGGELDMDDTANNGNNFIEYSSSGQASIEVTDGNLIVGSQIRRGLNSNTGILQYAQSGGIVELGKNAAPESNRGIFEVINAGSSFEHTGGSFTLVRDNNSPTVASLLLEPDAVNIADGTIITIGNGDTPSTQDRFGIQSNVELSEVEIASANITAKLYSLPLSTHILDIGTGVNFDANGFDLTILENLNNDGVFSTSGNSINDQITTFQVGTNATITGTGTTNFWNFEKTGSGTLSLSKNVTVNNNATIEDGTLNTQSSAFYIKKDLLHDAIHTSASTGPGIVFNGTQQQILDRSSSGTSEFGVVNLDNASGLLIRDTEENFRINEKLTLTTGVFDVGGNLIVFPADAYIENGIGGRGVDDFNVNNMIQTNSAIRDFGIRKYFNAVSAGNETFTYPVGLVAYTPIVVTINDISAGYITARPVRDIPPITEDDEFAICGDPNITDADNVLQYYWIIKSSGITGFNGDFSMRYDQNDVEVTSPYSLVNYGPARLYNTSDAWDKLFSNNDFDEATQQIHYDFNDQADATIEGIYTAGVTLENNGTSPLCGAAIPDQVPQFITNDSGGGNFFATTTYDGGVAPISGETPDITVKSGDILNFNQNNIRTRKITIESGAILVIQDGSSNHNLGFVTGEGTIRLESDGSSVVFPTGDYEEFFPDENCSGGGGLEYAGGGDYPVLTDLPNIRRVIFSGSGERVLPNNLSLNVCEDFDIRGDVEVIVFDGNSTIHVKGNVYKSNDSQFDNGGGSSRIVMEGLSAQSIQGNFTGTDAFNELEIDNPAGVTIVNAADATRSISANQDIVINENLILTNGVLTTNGNNTLTIASGGTYIGGSAISYVNGPLTQNNIVLNATYRFPIGKSGRYLPATISNVGAGNQNWTAEYFTSNQRDRTIFDPGTGADVLVDIANDMWRITSSGSNAARVAVNWNASSGVSDASDTRVVYWDDKNSHPYPAADNDGADNRWENRGGTSQSGGASGGSVTSVDLIPFSSTDISFGTANVVLPVELLSFSVKMEGKHALLQWVTASEKNNDFFEIERSVNGQDWKSLGTVKGAGDSYQELGYNFTDKNPLYGLSYYRLRQVDFDGQFDYSNVVVLENFEDYAVTPDPKMLLYPNPASLEELIIRAFNLKPWMEVEVMLLDAYGKQYIYELVMPEELEKGLALKQNLNLASGLYLVSIKQGSLRMQQKLILK
ncbi:hypothetical protein WJR50_20290 [Catalinimonas sp. 4WD22]|uniref:hypothetical protein n=1 Tax=Catalinimonas locisalis TaxID=3133978 RepID=UPI003100CF29